MKAIKVTASNDISIIDVDLNDWRELSNQIDGFIENVNTPEIDHWFKISGVENVTMICDREGRIKERPYNRLASMFYGEMYHEQPILGDVIFACYKYDYLISMDRAEKVVEDMLNCFRFLRRATA